jgi:hypothetical protein
VPVDVAGLEVVVDATERTLVDRHRGEVSDAPNPDRRPYRTTTVTAETRR